MMNSPRYNGFGERITHIYYHSQCIIKITQRFLKGKLLYSEYKNRLKFFRDGILRSLFGK